MVLRFKRLINTKFVLSRLTTPQLIQRQLWSASTAQRAPTSVCCPLLRLFHTDLSPHDSPLAVGKNSKARGCTTCSVQPQYPACEKILAGLDSMSSSIGALGCAGCMLPIVTAKPVLVSIWGLKAAVRALACCVPCPLIGIHSCLIEKECLPSFH